MSNRAGLTLLGALMAAACGGEPAPSKPTCAPAVNSLQKPVHTTLPITLGGRTSIVGLSEARRNAIVSIELSVDSERGSVLCSGVLSDAHWVLTAAHCLGEGEGGEEALTVRFGEDSAFSFHETAVARAVRHPSADVAALELAVPPDPELAVPLRLLREPGLPDSPSTVVIGGYGATGDLAFGTRLFAAAELLWIDERYFAVTAGPLSGACIGDSGGPLLWRDLSGDPLVLGLLSNGSGSCRGEDRYVRLDALGPWPAAFEADAPPADSSCGDLSAEGACFWNDVAVWCEQESTRQAVCAEGDVCAWDAAATGFRCVRSDSDACGGVSSWGRCEQGVALRCDRGKLTRQDCASCSDTCLRDPLSGQSGCMPID